MKLLMPQMSKRCIHVQHVPNGGWRRKLLAPLLISAFPAHASASEPDTEYWAGVSASGSIGGHWLGSAEISVRSDDAQMRQPTTVLRPMIGYQLHKNASVWIGYTRVEQHPDNGSQIAENRLSQQVSLNLGKIGNAHFSARTRIEQRSYEKVHGTAWRIRQQLRLAMPLQSDRASFIISTEPYFTLRTNISGSNSGLEQWRNFIGVNVPVTKSVALEAGYLNRYIKRRNAPNRVDHIFPVTLSYRF
ncbi:DUF2490 domain-containing protein [Sphingopyxis sp.]|uniref:DUF2490 domain-containing protein n=1 Tax=Sphingopyxis sp. TaxID=1908224 RepID=UPI001DA4F399|nr:DUF2490 domain-containing protein [Sphingopyxis sp.]MBW8294463.1 DUF2490 domain-containing protein [Sphingopyxis sp.]